MKITCKISNNNTNNYPDGKIQKLYQVIFWQNNFKEVSIYTGVVLGDGTNKLSNSFGYTLSYTLTNNTGNVVECEDLTNSYSKDDKGWRAVWGKEGSIIDTPDKLLTIYGSLNNKQTEECKTIFSQSVLNELNFNSNVFVHISSTERADNNYKCVAKSAASEILQNEKHKVNIKQSIQNFPVNIDILNWHKSIVKIPTSDSDILKSTTEFEYFLEIDRSNSDKSEAKEVTLYIVLPNNYELDTRKSTLDVIDNSDNKSGVQNPFREIYEKKIENYFSDWYKKENILVRNYYQLDKKRDIKQNEKGLIFKFRAINNVSPLYSQLFWTLVASIVIAYGLDYTRLSTLKEFFPDHLLFFKSIPLFPELCYILILMPMIFSLAPYLIANILNKASFDKLNFKNPITYSLLVTAIWFISIFVVGALLSYGQINWGTGLEPLFISYCKFGFHIVFIWNMVVFIWKKFWK